MCIFSLLSSQFFKDCFSFSEIVILDSAHCVTPKMESDATFLVWCDFRNYGSWQEVSKILINDAKVALSGGKFFGSSGEGWFRINCGHPRLKLLSAVDRICKTFKF